MQEIDWNINIIKNIENINELITLTIKIECVKKRALNNKSNKNKYFSRI